ncbi:DUF896 domain-containing protein [Aquisalibacillus elongatus]|uniref:UPF0291 protein EDC24_0794 n=1 Tax=Aquisalibacillus elongatus TaxID=485577 RepID=A0A3N5C1E9_9BACI|nr:DUF896 domain-containing protein [Aquisalibacillus elongatus]RPF55908.1 uncharacterized protein YnzC (UPF0291/DUF896 family) [Aquisalibacillus elongatus]
MISDERIKRINELANKSKTEGLTDQEKKEQKRLREEYLQAFRQSFKNQLKSVKVVDPEGSDVTPEKLKDEKNRDQNH